MKLAALSPDVVPGTDGRRLLSEGRQPTRELLIAVEPILPEGLFADAPYPGLRMD